MPRLPVKITRIMMSMLDSVCLKRGYESRSHAVRALILKAYSDDSAHAPGACYRLGGYALQTMPLLVPNCALPIGHPGDCLAAAHLRAMPCPSVNSKGVACKGSALHEGDHDYGR